MMPSISTSVATWDTNVIEVEVREGDNEESIGKRACEKWKEQNPEQSVNIIGVYNIGETEECDG